MVKCRMIRSADMDDEDKRYQTTRNVWGEEEKSEEYFSKEDVLKSSRENNTSENMVIIKRLAMIDVPMHYKAVL